MGTQNAEVQTIDSTPPGISTCEVRAQRTPARLRHSSYLLCRGFISSLRYDNMVTAVKSPFQEFHYRFVAAPSASLLCRGLYRGFIAINMICTQQGVIPFRDWTPEVRYRGL